MAAIWQHWPAPCRQHKSLRCHVPLVHHQEVKEYNQSAGQVVEVVRTVTVLKKYGFSYKFLFLRKGKTNYEAPKKYLQ